MPELNLIVKIQAFLGCSATFPWFQLDEATKLEPIRPMSASEPE
jgi:hypothetical protein